VDLAEEKCVPCAGDEAPLDDQAIQDLRAELPDWDVVEWEGMKRLERVFEFDDFGQALDFTNRVGELAEQEDHHPAILTEWGQTTVTWWTHKIGGLHKNDFVMAAKTDQLVESE